MHKYKRVVVGENGIKPTDWIFVCPAGSLLPTGSKLNFAGSEKQIVQNIYALYTSHWQWPGIDLEQTISIGIRRSVIWSRSIERHCSWTLAELVVLTSRNDCCEYQHHPHHLRNLWPMLSAVYHSVHCTHSLSCTGIYWKTLWLSKGRGIYWEVLCWPQRSWSSIVS